MVYLHKNKRGYWYIRKSIREDGKVKTKIEWLISKSLWQKPEWIVDEFEREFPNEKFNRTKLMKDMSNKIPVGVLKNEKKIRAWAKDNLYTKLLFNTYNISRFQFLWNQEKDNKKKKIYLKKIEKLRQANSEIGTVLNSNLKLKEIEIIQDKEGKHIKIKQLRLTSGDINFLNIYKNKKNFHTKKELIEYMRSRFKIQKITNSSIP